MIVTVLLQRNSVKSCEEGTVVPSVADTLMVVPGNTEGETGISKSILPSSKEVVCHLSSFPICPITNLITTFALGLKPSPITLILFSSWDTLMLGCVGCRVVVGSVGIGTVVAIILRNSATSR